MTDVCLSALPGSLTSGGSSQSPIQTKPLIPQKVPSRWTCNCHQGAPRLPGQSWEHCGGPPHCPMGTRLQENSYMR